MMAVMATAWVREDDESWKSAPTTVRMTVEERAKLRAEATSLGLSLQQLFELRLFGAIKPRRVPGRRPKPNEDQEELPIAG
jgi:hypothetical protein